MDETKEDSESIYINIEDTASASHSEVYENFLLNTAIQKPGSEAAAEKGQVCSGYPGAVCLGLLCVLLLAVIMGLSIKYNAEREQLWSSYANITKMMDQLQASNDNLTMERDRLQSKLSSAEKFCPHGWVKFMSRCYFVSLVKNTWDKSRQDCIRREADLVIIRSKEEQAFVSGLANNFWIGLTDHEHMGQWKWVDGRLLKVGYWMSGKPNNGLIQMSCVLAATGHVDALSSWINLQCNNMYTWICEKKIQCLFK